MVVVYSILNDLLWSVMFSMLYCVAIVIVLAYTGSCSVFCCMINWNSRTSLVEIASVQSPALLQFRQKNTTSKLGGRNESCSRNTTIMAHKRRMVRGSCGHWMDPVHSTPLARFFFFHPFVRPTMQRLIRSCWLRLMGRRDFEFRWTIYASLEKVKSTMLHKIGR